MAFEAAADRGRRLQKGLSSLHLAFDLILAGNVLAYLSFMPMIVAVVGGRKVYVADLVFAFLAVSIALVAIVRFVDAGVRYSRKARSSVWLTMLMAWALVGMIRGVSQHGLSAVGEARNFVFSMLFYVFVARLYGRRSIRQLVVVFATLVALMPVVRAIAFYAGGGKDVFVEDFSGSVILMSQAWYRFIQAGEAALVACVAVGMLIFAAEARVRKYWGGLLAVGLALLGVVAFVQVRSAWLMGVVGMLFGMVASARFRRYLVVGMVRGGVAVIALGIALWAQEQLTGRRADLLMSLSYGASFVKDPTNDETALWRLVVWRQALDSIGEHPVVGAGLGSYFETTDPNGNEIDRPFHNAYLYYLQKLGLVGLGLLVVGISVWTLDLARFVKNERDPYFRLLGKVLIVSAAMFATFAMFYDFVFGFWITIGAGTALVRGGSTVRSERRRRPRHIAPCLAGAKRQGAAAVV